MPCDGCTACCRAGYFIHVEPDEHAARALIPPELLFPAPGLPDGHHVLGHDTRGHCPLLVDDRCSIYASRPRACRRYDCRVFAATGTAPTEPAAAAVAERAVRWTFRHEDDSARVDHAAAAAATRFLERHAERLPRGCLPQNSTQRTLVGLRLFALFLPGTTGARASGSEAGEDAIQATLAAITERLAVGAG